MCAAAWTPPGRRTARVVFSTNLTGRYNLWTVPAAGGFPVQLTQSDDRQSGIAVTPDGPAIFECDHAGAEIYDLFAAPSRRRDREPHHTPDVSETRALFSPDGRSWPSTGGSRPSPRPTSPSWTWRPRRSAS